MKNNCVHTYFIVFDSSKSTYTKNIVYNFQTLTIIFEDFIQKNMNFMQNQISKLSGVLVFCCT